mgnify:CR=1 FL=1
MNIKAFTSSFWLTISACFLLVSCSTEKDAWLNRTFHQTTAKYNGYFNAGESFKEGLRVLDRGHQDDFSQILPVLKTGDERAAQSIYSYMDEAISKCANVIQYHSMVIRRKEKNKWIDENYLLIGKARFFKQEYLSSLEAFDFVIRKYPKSNSANEARIWLARAHMKLGNMNTVMTELEFMADQKDFPKKHREDLYAALADAEIIRGNYVDASRHLRRALEYARKKDKKIRYTYILAQLNQELNEYTIASGLYRKVARMNPPYEFVFNAKIARAMSFDVYSKNPSEIIEELEKMLKDDKNIDYLDQVYFALADVYLRQGNKGAGIENLRLSIKYNKGNMQQLGMAHFTLGELYFDQRRYVNAQAYYDSASTSFSAEHELYTEAVVKKNSLSDLVDYVQTIAREDSLQSLALMSESERNRAIDQIIEEVERKEAEKQAAQNDPFALQPGRNQGGNRNTGGDWYFYNPSAMSLGFSDFRRKWGNRKLEDHWRRKDKQSNIDFQTEEVADTSQVQADANRVTDPKKRDFYLQDIPLDKEKMQASELRMEEAYYRLGIIYKDKLQDYRAAISTFEKLIETFPGSVYELRAYYYLYTLYDKVGFRKEKDNYEAKILDEYPKSEIAQLIRDPEYFTKSKPNNQRAEKAYQKAFRAYENGRIDSVLNACTRAEMEFQDHPILPKFALLKALALGKKYGKETLSSELQLVVSAHNGHEVATEAARLVSILGQIEVQPEPKPEQGTVNQEEGASKGNQTDSTQVAELDAKDPRSQEEGSEEKGQDLPSEEEAKGQEEVEDSEKGQGQEAEASNEPVVPDNSPYSFKEKEDYNYILILPANEGKVDRLKAAYSDFNQEKFSLETLVIRNFLLGQEYQLVTIRGLKNAKDAMRYFSGVKNDPKLAQMLDEVDFKHFVISQSNFGTFYAKRDILGYQAFFESALLPLQSGN